MILAWKAAAAIIISYIAGCFNTGYYYTRIFYKKDVRSVGTNVTGATNVGRIAGRRGFVITFLGDALKGALIVLLCRGLALNETITLVCILMVITGHILPVQLHFKGGKGMSTMFGTYLTFNPIFILYLLITCIIIFPFVRRYTITCLFALVLFPAALAVTGFALDTFTIMALCSLAILYACRNNLKEFFKNKLI